MCNTNFHHIEIENFFYIRIEWVIRLIHKPTDERIRIGFRTYASSHQYMLDILLIYQFFFLKKYLKMNRQ